MQFSYNWLKTWVETHLPAEKLGDLLTMSGLEVERITPAAPPFTNVVVARVLTLAKHPNADRLQVASVDVGTGSPVQIVCGAKNVAVDAKVPCALPCAVLPGNFKIKPTKMRGVESNGMLCAAQELGLEPHSEGLLILPANAPVGQNLRDYLQLDDELIEIKSTPNRADCLSIEGIAREVAALTGKSLIKPEIPSLSVGGTPAIATTIAAPEACGRFITAELAGVKANTPTPAWIQERLTRSNIHPVSFLVDIGNYVMLELGQPLHIFDRDKINSNLDVRYARKGETLTCLNGKDVTLNTETLIVADSNKGPLSIAGLMGGAASAVSGETHNILIEAAFFYPEVIAGKARAYGFGSESSYRFERGVDYAGQKEALSRAIALIQAAAGGEVASVTETLGDLPGEKKIVVRLSRAEKILGIALDSDTVKNDLARLGLKPEATSAGFTITAPSFRFDINLEIDVIEEIARLYGYDKILPKKTSGQLFILPKPAAQIDEVRVAEKMADLGYQEVINYAFVNSEWEKDFAGNSDPIKLQNPISSQMNVLRSTLIGSLVNNFLYNYHRKQSRVRLFEIAKTFKKTQTEFSQETYLAALAAGELYPETWANPREKVDFFDVKNDVIQLLKNKNIKFLAGKHPSLHPGRSALIEYNHEIVGFLGELHPRLQQKYELPHAPCLFEIKYDLVSTRAPIRYRPISKYQPVRRDLAFIVPDAVSGAELLAALSKNKPQCLKTLEIFDIYKDERVAEKSKSVAVKLIFQDDKKTLRDEEIEALTEGLLEKAKSVGATLRK